MSSVNMPQSRNRKTENFPVGSFLISSKLRKIVHLYYNFARASDDISDNPRLQPEAKRELLCSMQKALKTGEFSSGHEKIAARLGRILQERGIRLSVAGDLLKAFIQDTEQNRYETWEQLWGYCQNSAAPVGRFLLAIHGEDKAAVEPSDALCISLQILNHLQDTADDLRNLDRCYLPEKWMKEENVSLSDLLKPRASDEVKRLFGRVLDKVDQLNQKASELPRYIHDVRLRVEASVIVQLAHLLAQKLRKEDPLEQRVSLTFHEKAEAILKAVPSIFLSSFQKRLDKDGLSCSYRDIEAIEKKVIAAKTSFYKGMRILPKARRDAMYGIYVLCRELDDIADGDSSAGKDVQKSLELLDQWSERIEKIYQGDAKTPLERVLEAAIARYDLKSEDFQEIIEGMRMDLEGPIIFPPEKILDRYCDRVASAVGRLSVRIFGARGENSLKVAYHLGRALQQVNILRDIKTDSKLGRCYLPKELAIRFNLPKEIWKIPFSPSFPEVCAILADRAKDHFRQAEYYMDLCPEQTMRPARLMAASYKATLKSLENRGWDNFEIGLPRSVFWKIFYFLRALVKK